MVFCEFLTAFTEDLFCNLWCIKIKQITLQLLIITIISVC